jgi:hypothetical protein
VKAGWTLVAVVVAGSVEAGVATGAVDFEGFGAAGAGVAAGAVWL